MTTNTTNLLFELQFVLAQLQNCSIDVEDHS